MDLSGKPFTLKIAVFGSLIDDIIQRRSVTYQGYDSLTYDGDSSMFCPIQMQNSPI